MSAIAKAISRLCPLSRLVAVRPSKHGLGVFAARRFRAGQVIADVRGTFIIQKNYSSDYCVDLGYDRALEPSPPFRFLNHGCEPNAELVHEKWNRSFRHPGGRLYLEAAAQIAEGEELLIDYAWPAHSAIVCLCGSPKCRGWIVAEEERWQLDVGTTSTSADRAASTWSRGHVVAPAVDNH